MGIKDNPRIVAFITLLFSRGNSRKRAKLLKKSKIFHSYGEGGLWQSTSLPSEPSLVSIGNNVSVAANVRFVTHDVIQSMLRDMNNENYPINIPFYLGKIEVLDNVMIGANTTILYNTKIGPNAVIAAGSVVTKDVPPDSIVGGNPAKVIGSLSQFAKKRYEEDKGRPYDISNKEEIERFFWE